MTTTRSTRSSSTGCRRAPGLTSCFQASCTSGGQENRAGTKIRKVFEADHGSDDDTLQGATEAADLKAGVARSTDKKKVLGGMLGKMMPLEHVESGDEESEEGEKKKGKKRKSTKKRKNTDEDAELKQKKVKTEEVGKQKMKLYYCFSGTC